MEQIQPQAGVGAPKHRSGKQELYPESGLFVSSTRLATIHAEAKKDCLRLFHLLFDEALLQSCAEMLWPLGSTGRGQMGRQSWISSKSKGL